MAGILDDVWILVTLTDSVTYDDYGVPTTTGSTVYTISGVLVPMDNNAEQVKSGVLNQGDLIGFFYPDDGSVVKMGQRTTYDNKEFEVAEEPILYSLQSDKIIRQASFKRFHKP
jgi:hypothetical protein